MARKGQKGQVTRKKDPLAPEIGRRITEAYERARFATFTDFVNAVHLNERLLRRYMAGETMPGARALMHIAQACGVSIDWLMLGAERPSPELTSWLETELGKTATADERRILRFLPLAGFEVSERFYDLALHAIRSGLEPGDAVKAARARLDRE